MLERSTPGRGGGDEDRPPSRADLERGAIEEERARVVCMNCTRDTCASGVSSLLFVSTMVETDMMVLR